MKVLNMKAAEARRHRALRLGCRMLQLRLEELTDLYDQEYEASSRPRVVVVVVVVVVLVGFCPYHKHMPGCVLVCKRSHGRDSGWMARESVKASEQQEWLGPKPSKQRRAQWAMCNTRPKAIYAKVDQLGLRESNDSVGKPCYLVMFARRVGYQL